MNKTLTLFIQAFWQCLQALPMSLLLTGLSVGLGFMLAVPLAVAHHRKITLKARLVQAYVYVFTGTPLLVQIYVIYYGIPSVEPISSLMQVPALSFLKDAFVWALLALVLNTAAYSTVIFSGAIRNTDAGEIEAARAYGMNPYKAMWRIILPSSLRRALPAYSNEFIMTMQSTSLVSVITIVEMTNAARQFATKTYEPFIAYGAAAVIYLVLTMVLVGGFKLLEKRYMAYLKPMTT